MDEFYGVYTVSVQLLKSNGYSSLSSPSVGYNISKLFLYLP